MDWTRFVLLGSLVGLGIVVHFLKKLYDLEHAGTILKPTTYVRENPYTFAFAVLSAYALALVCYYVDQLTEVTALLIGVSCDSAFDSMRARAAGMLRKQNGGT